jgi:hypothetical protein
MQFDLPSHHLGELKQMIRMAKLKDWYLSFILDLRPYFFVEELAVILFSFHQRT